MDEIAQGDLQLIVSALDMQTRRLLLRARSRAVIGEGFADHRKQLRERATRPAELAEMFRRQAAAGNLATRAMDIIDKAVSDGILLAESWTNRVMSAGPEPDREAGE